MAERKRISRKNGENVKGGKKRVALYVDFANVWANTKDGDQKIGTIDFVQKAKEIGHLVSSNVYLAVKAGEKVHGNILSFEREGYDVITRFVPNTEYGEKKDIDTYLITDFISDVFTLDLDVMILASDDSDYSPALKKANEMGIHVISIISSLKHARVVANSSNEYYEICCLEDWIGGSKEYDGTLEVFP